jgi:hypothetical protein
MNIETHEEMIVVTCIKGELEPPIEIQLENNEEPISLAGKTVTADAVNSSGTLFSRSATVYDATNGIIRIALQSSDTANAGTWRMYISATTDGEARPQIWPVDKILKFVVREK